MSDTSTTAQVLASEQSLLDAMKASDAERLDALLHDDLLFNGPDGSTATKALDLRNYRSGNINLHTVRSSDQTVSVIGDTAVVAVTVELKGSYLGQLLDGRFRYLRVWKQFDGDWKVIAGSVVPLSADG
jgi:ketosteroid isomerase-like protein